MRRRGLTSRGCLCEPVPPSLRARRCVALTSCSEDGSGASASTVEIQPSSYVVKDPVTTTTAPAVPAGPDEEGLSAGEQSFTDPVEQRRPLGGRPALRHRPRGAAQLQRLGRGLQRLPRHRRGRPHPTRRQVHRPVGDDDDRRRGEDERDRRRDRRDDRRDDRDARRRPVQPDLRRRERRRPARDHAQVRHHARAAQRRQHGDARLAEPLHRPRDQASTPGRLHVRSPSRRWASAAAKRRRRARERGGSLLRADPSD